MEINSFYVQTKTTKLFWKSVKGVYISGHEDDDGHLHIVFHGGKEGMLLTCPYTSETWANVLAICIGWITGPCVQSEFKCSSVWREADVIRHNTERIYVSYQGVVECNAETYYSDTCDECE